MAFTMAATYAATTSSANDAHAPSNVAAAAETGSRSTGATKRYGHAEEF